jgi:hypothetical protein
MCLVSDPTFHMCSCLMTSPDLLPSVVTPIHVFTDSISVYYIACTSLCHVLQSEYRICSPSSNLFPPLNSARLGPPSRHLVKQAPRLVVILPGSPLLLAPRLLLPSFLFPPARNITGRSYNACGPIVIFEQAFADFYSSMRDPHTDDTVMFLAGGNKKDRTRGFLVVSLPDAKPA